MRFLFGVVNGESAMVTELCCAYSEVVDGGLDLGLGIAECGFANCGFRIPQSNISASPEGWWCVGSLSLLAVAMHCSVQVEEAVAR